MLRLQQEVQYLEEAKFVASHEYSLKLKRNKLL